MMSATNRARFVPPLRLFERHHIAFFVGAIVLLAIVASGCSSAGRDEQRTSSSIAILHVTIIDGTGAEPKPDHTVFISGDRIVAVGPSDTVKVPANARQIDATERYLIPGLWDFHVHTRYEGIDHLRLFISNGITSIRDLLGSNPASVGWMNLDLTTVTSYGNVSVHGEDLPRRLHIPHVGGRPHSASRSCVSGRQTRPEMGPGQQDAYGRCGKPENLESHRRARIRGPLMKIKSAKANNRRKAFEVKTHAKSLFFPYAKADPCPTADDPVEEVRVDKELGREAFVYVLKSGVEGTIHIDQVLEYNQDPGYLRDLLLYRLTLEAQKRVEESALPKREIIRRLGTSAAQFYRLLDQTNYRKSVDQVLNLLHVLDCDVDLVVTTKSA
jgi:hypothetical protein